MEKIICKVCGSIYELEYVKIPMRDKDSIDCSICGTQLYKWNEAKMWKAKLVQTGEKRNISE